MSSLRTCFVASTALVLALVSITVTTPLLAENPASATGSQDLGHYFFQASATGVALEHFERGVGALHSFWYDEAADAFRAAQAADPSFAMAYWGEAMTDNHPVWAEVDLDAGRAVLERLGATPAERAAKAPTERERAYLAAVETLYFGAGDKVERDRAYSLAMEELYRRWPDDLEAGTFYALSILGLVYGGDPGDQRYPQLMRAAAILEELVDLNPEHPGVLHYLIHSYDDPTHAPLGLRAARTYARIAPSAHHALHMPSHIFVQLGRWQDVASSNENAWAASVAWVERRGLDPDKRDFHSLSWLHYAYLQQRRLKKAEEVLALARGAVAEGGGHRAHHALETIEARHLLETGATAAELPAGDSAALLYAVGVVSLRGGDQATAATALERLRSASDGGGMHGEEGAVPIMVEELAGLAALAADHTEEGLEHLRQAVELESSQPPPSGPPYPMEPAHEVYGKALLAAGRPAAALEQLEAALARTPQRPAVLLAAARASAAAGDAAGARRYYGSLAEIWATADPGQAEVVEVTAFLGAPEAEGVGD